MLAWQINRAAMHWGRYVDARLEELIEVPDNRPRKDKPTRLVRKYHSYAEALGLAGPSTVEEILADPDVVNEARALLAGEIDFLSWLGEDSANVDPGGR